MQSPAEFGNHAVTPSLKGGRWCFTCFAVSALSRNVLMQRSCNAYASCRTTACILATDISTIYAVYRLPYYSMSKAPRLAPCYAWKFFLAQNESRDLANGL